MLAVFILFCFSINCAFGNPVPEKGDVHLHLHLDENGAGKSGKISNINVLKVLH